MCASSWWTTSPPCATRSTARCGWTGTRSSSPATAARRSTRSPTQPPDAIVLDVLMPELDGLEVCRRLRAAGDRMPVLMLTARDAVADRVAGLDAGADDYLVKPFALEELLRAAARAARGAAARRRAERPALRRPRRWTRPATRSRRGGRPIELTRTEFMLLELFLRHPRQVLTRAQIFERVWGYDFGPTLELARGLRRLPAPQDRGGGEPRLHPDGARRRLRAARADELPRAGSPLAAAPRWRCVVVLGCGPRTASCGDSCARRSTTRCATRSRSAVAPGRPGAGDAIPAAAAPADPAAPPAFVTEIRRTEGVGPGRRSAPLADDADLRAVGRGRKEPFFADRESTGRTSACTRPGSATARAVRRAPAHGGRPALSHAALGAAAARAGRDRAGGDPARRLAMRAAVRPVAELTDDRRARASTRDLTRRIDAHGDDELARLAAAFNTMLEALERSQRAQRQLVADASHELRTPLTSLRTNLEVLARGEPLDAGRPRTPARGPRRPARGAHRRSSATSSSSRATRSPRTSRTCASTRSWRARWSGRAGTRRTSPTRPSSSRRWSAASPARLDRAVGNLLDNAAK